MQTDIIVSVYQLKIEPNRLLSALGLGAGRLMSILVALVVVVVVVARSASTGDRKSVV